MEIPKQQPTQVLSLQHGGLSQIGVPAHWTGIVKVQRPIVTTNTTPDLLVYNKGRTLMINVPPEAHLIERFGDAPKFYCIATIKDGQIEFGTTVPHPGW